MEWPVTVDIVVPWRDLDGAGHVNNAVYFSYMETARVEAYFRAVGKDPRATHDPADLDIILARATCDFRAQLNMGDRVRVSVWPARVGTSSFALRYELRVADSGVLAAEGESVQVCFDYAKQQKVPVPERLRKALEAGLPKL